MCEFQCFIDKQLIEIHVFALKLCSWRSDWTVWWMRRMILSDVIVFNARVLKARYVTTLRCDDVRKTLQMYQQLLKNSHTVEHLVWGHSVERPPLYKDRTGWPRHRENREFGCSFSSRQGKRKEFVKKIKDIFLHREFTSNTRKMLKTQRMPRDFCLDRSVATLQGNWWHVPIMLIAIINLLSNHFSLTVKKFCPLTDRWREGLLYFVYHLNPKVTTVKLRLTHSAKTKKTIRSQKRGSVASSPHTRDPIPLRSNHTCDLLNYVDCMN